MLRPTYPLRTARLLLRPFTPEDVDDVWAYQRQPEVARYLAWEVRDRLQSQAAVDQMSMEDTLTREGDCLTLAVLGSDIDKVVGQVELVWLSEKDRQGELGYMFNPRFQGKGLATEAALEVLRLGFDDLGLHRIIGRCVTQNTASVRLLERLGMRREAHFIDNATFKGGWREESVYAMLQREWRERATR